MMDYIKISFQDHVFKLPFSVLEGISPSRLEEVFLNGVAKTLHEDVLKAAEKSRPGRVGKRLNILRRGIKFKPSTKKDVLKSELRGLMREDGLSQDQIDKYLSNLK